MRKTSRSKWIAGAFEALCDGGIDALRVEPLAVRLGVTKGSFYHHFKSRRDLHLAMLNEWERAGTSQIIDEVDRTDVDPVARLRRLAQRTMAADPASDGIETSIRAWAATDDVVAAATARVDARRLDYTTALLREAGLPARSAKSRARLLYRILIGEYMWRSSGGPKTTEREIDELVDLLIARPR